MPCDSVRVRVVLMLVVVVVCVCTAAFCVLCLIVRCSAHCSRPKHAAESGETVRSHRRSSWTSLQPGLEHNAEARALVAGRCAAGLAVGKRQRTVVLEQL